ncbi:hypothetical protein TTHERM_00455470 (macronuclear) [Tetrahymena thermophila SB210]|uniref:Uncharacterized protein n=1 Tax=Tetrahymena thermophila (strain SB210) TaxID=312017 RepID=I7LX77_TETTS|nr:hypothetical protein TTHERM_00455470 [Tetrahymena thermophila SB210]EAS03908.2 hypothetical protein TTHERM_00455470 [Tetrahymena thermophila SB210]|eukprot:XP_001024153.2 hypothetical protein TTHERM_00455470 [Tetrahymena thermophila SB210]
MNNDNIRSPRTPTLNNNQSPKVAKKNETKQDFKIKKFKRLFFRNYQESNEPGIVVFLLKPMKQEKLESLIFEIYQNVFKGIQKPSFLYFDSQKRVIKSKEIKPDSLVYFYIVESEIDQNNNLDIRQSDLYLQMNSTIEEQESNLDIFVMKETEYTDLLNGKQSLDTATLGYTSLQFQLEKSFQNVWDYLEDFSQVSHQRRIKLVETVDVLENKREEVNRVSQELQDLLEQYKESEAQVIQCFEQMGFDCEFILQAKTIQSRSRYQNNNKSILSSQQYEASINQDSYIQDTESIYDDNLLPSYPRKADEV